MRRGGDRLVAGAVLLAVAACGSSATTSPTTETTATSAQPVVTTPSLPDDTTPADSPVGDGSVPVHTAPETTPSTPPPTDPEPPPDDTPAPFELGPAPLDRLGARPGAELDWDEVGAGWIVFGFAEPTEVDGEYAEGLYTISPADGIFGLVGWRSIGGLPSVTPSRADPRFANVVITWDGGTPAWTLDLATLTWRADDAPVSDAGPDVNRWIVASERDGDRFVVDWSHTTPGGTPERVTLSRLPAGGSTITTLVDLELTPEDSRFPGPLSFVELDSGELVTVEIDRVWLRRADGTAIRELAAPSTECDVRREWPDARVLVSCADPGRAEGCWTRGLWLVPLDGSMAEPLDLPAGEYACYARSGDAHPIGEALLLSRWQGEGECETAFEIAAGGSTQPWNPPGSVVCQGSVIGVRDGRWIVLAHGYATYPGPNILYEVATDRSTRALTPDVSEPDRWVPGVRTAVVVG